MVVDECRPLADLNTNLRGGVAFVKEEPLKSTTLDEGQPLKEKLQGRLDSNRMSKMHSPSLESMDAALLLTGSARS